MWSSWRDAFVGRRGLGDHPVEQRGELDQRQLVGEREGAVLGAQLRRDQEQPPVGVVELADIAELGLRHDPRASIPHASFSRRRIGSDIDSGSLSAPPSVSARFLQLGIMVAVLLDIVAHPILGRDQRARVAGAGQAGVAAGFLQRGVEPGDGVGDRRRIVGQLGQLVARHAEVAEQRVGEDLGQLVGPGARRRRPAAKAADVDLISLGQLEQQRRGHRPLVALEMVQIARADRRGSPPCRSATGRGRGAGGAGGGRGRACRGHRPNSVNFAQQSQVKL